MNILVTGADGQLGMSLRKIAARYSDHAFFWSDLPDADITDRAAMEMLADETGADAIINCAAYTAVDQAEGEPDAAMRVNRDGAAVMAGIAVRRGIPLVHISTDYVFDGKLYRPLTEQDEPSPINVYGLTKLAGERAVREAGCDAAVVRTSWLYSEFGHNFVRTMVRLGAQGKPLQIVDDQTGCPTCATGLAEAVMVLVSKEVKGFEIYNYCDRGQTTWYEFALEIFGQTGMDVVAKPVSTAEYPTQAQRPAYSVLSTAKIERMGIEPRPWKERLGECLDAMGLIGGMPIK